jgi:hypothetical protein
MRVWVMVLCVMGGCAENAGMRPRGLRNSVRIESLERRIAQTEQKLGITPERPPPQPRTDLQQTDLDVRLDGLTARMAKLDERLTALLAAQVQIQQELAELRKAAPVATPTSP